MPVPSSQCLISSFGLTSATRLSTLLDGTISHDKITRFLSEREYTSKDLWLEVKSTVRKIEGEERVLIFDDTIEDQSAQCAVSQSRYFSSGGICGNQKAAAIL